MSLTAGSRLGSYEIVGPLGAGGMGEVYQATDTTLKRSVAIKILPDAVASDVERLARFQREAEVLASLNHPNIAAIYGLERIAGTTALVMELVDGLTLADRLRAGPVPLDEALPIAQQIAEALEAAHERGIVHRDLKPANIKVRPDGTVKVLDFGLAKAIAPTSAVTAAASQSPTITTPAMTRAGMILGTAAYMSPEQARGKPVDRRADLWAFGAVLYEMLSGAQAFQGEDVGEVLAAVLKTDVDWSLLPGATPPGIQTLVRRCLRKDPRQRLGDAGAARMEISDARLAIDGGPTTASQHGWRLSASSIALVAGGIAIGLALGVAVWLRNRSEPSAHSAVTYVTASLPRGTELSEGPSVALSPDGGHLAYVASRGSQTQLYLRAMNGFGVHAIPQTDGAIAPFFSPDGRWLAFFADGKLKKVSITGGVVATLADRATNFGGAWGPDDTIAFVAQGTGLAATTSAGGPVRRLTNGDDNQSLALSEPAFLPGEMALLVTSSPSGASTADERSIEILTLKTGERKVLIQGGTSARYLPTGHIVFQRSGKVMAAAFDLDRLELVSAPIAVIDGVRQPFTGTGAFSCSAVGSCVYVAGGMLSQRTVAFVDRSGGSRPLPLPPRNYGQPRFSPKGDKLAFWMIQLRCDIEVYDIARGTTTRLTSDGDNHLPIWTADGNVLTYISRKGPAGSGYELVSKPANGSGSEESLTATALKLGGIAPLSWSRQDNMLAFADRGDIWLLPLGGDRVRRPFVQSKFNETTPAFSPDGRWLAYVSDESGRYEVYVAPYPGPGEKYPISTNGGIQPVWARSGRELFFRSGDEMMVTEVRTQSSFTATRPKLLFVGPFARADTRIDYDISPDGARFVMLHPGEQERPATEINVLLNWFEELKARVPAK